VYCVQLCDSATWRFCYEKEKESPRSEVWRVSCLGRCLWFVEEVQLFDGPERKVDDDWRVKKSEDVSGWSGVRFLVVYSI
jgi:hypothetical protein